MTNELRYVFGTRTNKWYLVDNTDRDFNTGIKKEFFENNSEEMCRALYLNNNIV